ncbi:hypothetical protein DKK74_08485 [Bifidobacterium asteroides]|uniref:Uncharacterized protein n=1 Tax=Bifidobacterium asteroides TaxID=1684 RepID=A0A318MFM1_9BIFI|nr:hypothetical protein DKK74_08485 [Bifidobacterium asteroides]
MANGSLEFIKAYYRMVRRVQPMSRLMQAGTVICSFSLCLLWIRDSSSANLQNRIESSAQPHSQVQILLLRRLYV